MAILPLNGFTLFDKGNGNTWSVEGMFGDATLDTFQDKNLRNFYSHVFGGWASGVSLLDYASKGTPNAGAVYCNLDSNDHDSARLAYGFADTGGLQASYQVWYGKANEFLNPEFGPEAIQKSKVFTYHGPINDYIRIDNLEPYTDYKFQFHMWNNFISEPADHIKTTVREFKTGADPLPGAPAVYIFTFLNDTDRWRISFDYAPTGYDQSDIGFLGQFRVNEGAWNTYNQPGDVTNQQNWGTSGMKMADWKGPTFQPDDDVDFRIRAVSHSIALGDSGWSQPARLYEGTEGPIQ